MTELTPSERWANVLACAEAENKAMLGKADIQAPNHKGNSHGGPIMSEIKRNKSASEILRLSQQGFSIAEVARFTATPVETVLWRARKYRIKFRGGANISP